MKEYRVISYDLNNLDKEHVRLMPQVFINESEAKKWCFAYAHGIKDILNDERHQVKNCDDKLVCITGFLALRIIDSIEELSYDFEYVKSCEN